MRTISHLILIVLAAMALGISACSMLTRDIQAKDSEGHLLYVGPDGKATAEPVTNGQKNEPLMIPESNGTLEGLQAVGSGLPQPFGAILGAVGSVGVAGLGAYLEMKRRKANALIDEYERSIDKNPEVRKTIDEKLWADLPEALKARLNAVKA